MGDNGPQKGLMFRMGSERYVIDISEVEGVMENKKPVLIPGSPSYLTGILNIRGNLTVLIDLRDLLGITGSKRADIILMNLEGRRIGIVVDKVDDIVDYTHDEIFSLPVARDRDTDMFVGVLRKDDETLIFLSEEGLIKALEVEV